MINEKCYLFLKIYEKDYMNKICIFFVSMFAQSLFGMNIPCTKIEKIELPEITQPCGIGFICENVIAVLEEFAFIVCDIDKKNIVIQKKTEDKIHDFAISKQGEKIA